MNNILKIGVVIRVPGLDSSIEEPSLGIWGGEIRLSETSTTIGAALYLPGKLAKQWVGTITRSADIRRKGSYAAINGATIRIDANFGLLEWLKVAGLSLYNAEAVVAIEYTDEAGTAVSRPIYTGTVTSVTPDLDIISIGTESASKSYRSPAAETIEGKPETKPVFLGEPDGKYTRGIRVNEGDEDILFDGEDKATMWQVYESRFGYLNIFPIKPSPVGYFDMLIYAQSIEESTLPVYVSCISGEGEGAELKLAPYFVYNSNVEIIQRTDSGTGEELIGLRVDIDDPGNVVGITGRFYDKYNTGDVSYFGETYSIVKLITRNDYIQMDGWGDLSRRWDGTAFTYDPDSDTYSPAPEYGGAWKSEGDRMLRGSTTGDAYLDPGFVTGIVTPAGFPLYPVDYRDVSDLSASDYPEEVRGFFNLVNENRITAPGVVNAGAWVKFDGGEIVTASVPANEEDYKNAFDKSANVAFTIGVNSPTNPTSSFKNASCVLAVGLPQFDVKPDELYLTMRVDVGFPGIGVGTDVMVGVIVDDFREKKLVAYRYYEDHFTARNNPPNAGATVNTVENIYPPAVNDGGSYTNSNYNYKDPNVEGNKQAGACTVGRDAFRLDLPEYVLENQSNIYLVFSIKNSGTSWEDFDLVTVNEIAWVGSYKSEPDRVVFGYGTRNGTGTPAEAYLHALRLQDYSSRGIARPLNGWGTEYPSGVDALIDVSSNYGGATNPALAPNAILQGQKLTESESNTDALKAELTRTMWGMGTVDYSGVEKIYPIVDALTSDDGVLVEYHDIEGEYDFDVTLPSDIFTRGEVLYGYDTVSGKYRGRIAVTNVDASSYKSSYVEGVSDTNTAALLWSMANALYKTYRTKNEFPEDLGKLPLVKNEAGAVDFLLGLYRRQGVTGENAYSLEVLETYRAAFKLPLDYIIDNDLDHGSKIRLDIPTVTDAGNYHRGIISAISIPIRDRSLVSITASMVGNVSAGGGRVIIRESGSQDTIIRESGSQDTIIREGR